LLFFAASTTQALQFNSTTKEFVIVQFTDMHCGNDDGHDAQTHDLQRRIIDSIKPDLIVITGDAVAAENAKDIGWFERTWQGFTSPMVEAGVPYIYTLGNHDNEGDLTKEQMVQLDETNPMSLRGTSEGIPNTTNYMVPIYSSRNESELAAHIWSLDSGTVSCGNRTDGYGCIEREVVEWYDEESQNIRETHGRNVHHLAFYHIPIPEYIEVYNDQDFYGEYNEYVWCPVVNTGFFEAVKRNGDISAMFVGHDHVNDYGGFYEGVELVYGRKTGFHAYGDKRGAKVIVLKENYDDQGRLNVTRSHYIYEENGAITHTEPLRRRSGPIQEACPTFDLSGSSFFENIQRNILIFVLICLYIVF